MAGYLAGRRPGAAIYNLCHSYTAPLVTYLALWYSGRLSYSWLILIWFAHIAFDRLLGYGLKYESAFKDTHLQRV